MFRGHICSSVFLQLLVFLQFGSIGYAFMKEEKVECTYKTMKLVRLPSKQVFYKWPEECQVFKGSLLPRMIDLECANFTNLETIYGQYSLISTKMERLPDMPNLKAIYSHIQPAVVILNNKYLQDLRGLVNYRKKVEIRGSRMPVFISGNPELDTVNYPKMFHTPYSPLMCEKRLTPNFHMVFADSQSLAITLVCLALVITVFLYPLGMGSANVYFVPGYHKAESS